MKKFLNNKEGHILAWVVMLTLVSAVISVVVVSAALTASRTTLYDHKRQQAQFTAKAAAQSVANYIIDNSSNPDVIENLVNTVGKGSAEGMGEYDVEVKYEGTDKIKIKSKATYNGETKTQTITLSKKGGATPEVSVVVPTDKVIYSNGPFTNGFGQGTVIGDVYVNGDFAISYGASIDGEVIVNGNARIDGGSQTTKILRSFGNVNLNGSGKILGDVFAKGDITFDGGTSIGGNLYADKNLNMPQGEISGNAFIGGNASFSGGKNKIKGSLYYKGKLTAINDTIENFINGKALGNYDYKPWNSTPYEPNVLRTVSAPTGYTDEILLDSRGNISTSGKFTQKTVNAIKNKFPGWGSTIYLDAMEKDLIMIFDNFAFNDNGSLGNGYNFEVKKGSKYNVYIYLNGKNANFSTQGLLYFGMEDREAAPQVFIFGDNQTVDSSQYSALSASIYIPNGKFMAANSSPYSGYKFAGSCIVKEVEVNGGVKLIYKKPKIEGTPLENLFTGGGSTGGGTPGSEDTTWSIENWGN